MGWPYFAICLVVLTFSYEVFFGAPYVPSHKKYVRQALKKLYKINGDDVIVDIGSGDGLVLREAARLGAKRAVGYEINPILVFISNIVSVKYRQIDVYFASLWTAKLPDDTTVIYIFSVERDMNKLANKIQNETNRLGHVVFVISYANEFVAIRPTKQVGPNRLYEFLPLQTDKAQV